MLTARRALAPLALAAALAAPLALPALAPAAGAFADKDSSDFRTQAPAQRFFLRSGGVTKDPHGLDGPVGPAYSGTRGVACESLP